jgi:hypothetical protein
MRAHEQSRRYVISASAAACDGGAHGCAGSRGGGDAAAKHGLPLPPLEPPPLLLLPLRDSMSRHRAPPLPLARAGQQRPTAAPDERGPALLDELARWRLPRG